MIFSVLDHINHFIFNWNTYYWMIPVWVVIFGTFCKVILKEKITIGHLPGMILGALFNPILNLFVCLAIIVIPFCLAYFYIFQPWWEKVRKKEIL